MERWNQLIATALVGTGRQPLRLPPPGDPLDELLAGLNAAEPEKALLGAAAAISLYQRAGKLPVYDETPAPALCPPDQLPAVPARATQHLDTMLRGNHREALAEWLMVAARNRQRAPEEFLVGLLELGKTRESLRDLILPVLGVRGRWLAAQTPAWAIFGETLDTTEQEEATWQTGTRAQRLAVLKQVRKAYPERARSMLESTWATEKADDRTAFVEVFDHNLSMADEPFLEKVLDDRSGEVRAAAAGLLSELPESRLVQRMRERLASLLGWTPGEPARMLGLKPGRSPELSVTLPAELDKAMQRDGIKKDTSPTFKGGQKAWWLSQMLSTVPTQHWYTTWNTTPAELLAATLESEWADALLSAWNIAARRSRDAALSELLLIEFGQRAGNWRFEHLTPNLPPGRLDSMITEQLQIHQKPLDNEHPAFMLLAHCQQPWSRELSLAVLDSIRRRASADNSNNYSLTYLRSLLPSFALYMPPELAEHAASGWPTHMRAWSFWAEWVDQMEAMLHFRRDMLAALAGN